MAAFSEKARLAGVAARKRNAKLRREGKLPPTKSKYAGSTSIPLDSPIFDVPEKRPYKKGGKLKVSGDNRELVLRLLTLIERLV